MASTPLRQSATFYLLHASATVVWRTTPEPAR